MTSGLLRLADIFRVRRHVSKVTTAVILPGEADSTSTYPSRAARIARRVERTVRLHVKLGSCDRESSMALLFLVTDVVDANCVARAVFDRLVACGVRHAEDGCIAVICFTLLDGLKRWPG